VWDPGDGGDTVEGQAGTDTMWFSGSCASENIDLSPNGSRLRFFRDVASVTMDVNELETVDFQALAAPTPSPCTTSRAPMWTPLRSTSPAPSARRRRPLDRVIVNATNDNDLISVLGSGTHASVVGLTLFVSIKHAELPTTGSTSTRRREPTPSTRAVSPTM